MEFVIKIVIKLTNALSVNINYTLNVTKRMKITYVNMIIKRRQNLFNMYRVTDQHFFAISSLGINKDIEDIRQSLLPHSSLESFKGVNDIEEEEETPVVDRNYVDIKSFNHTKIWT